MKFNKPILAGSLLAISLFNSGVISQDYHYTVGANIQNAFAIETTTELSFGTVSAAYDDDPTDTEISTLTVSPDGTVTVVTDTVRSTMISMGGAAPAVFTITGANPGSILTITNPADPVELSNSNPLVAEVFDVTGYTFLYTNNDGGEIFTPTVGADGSLVITLGATLGTDADAAAGDPGDTIVYSDTTYSGTIAFDISY